MTNPDELFGGLDDDFEWDGLDEFKSELESDQQSNREADESGSDDFENELPDDDFQDDEEEDTRELSDLIAVKVSEDMMIAFIIMPSETDAPKEWRFTAQDMMAFLSEEGIVYGVDPLALKDLCDEPVYGTEIPVATGEPATQGIPGEYEFHFDTVLDKKPVIREDGTVDFMAIKTVETVKKDDLIVTYHPAVQGTPGTNVFGYDVQPKPERELPPLGGTGFERSEDGTEYHAALSGKIEYTENSRRIVISPVFEVSANVGVDIGDIEFQGDVIIHGTVSNDAEIKAAGSITIDGLVESCKMSARKDMVLKSGVKGNEETELDVKGNLTAEFIEFATVRVGGNIEADVLFNSFVECDGLITMQGEHASILGGVTAAVEGVQAYTTSNAFGVKTEIYVGVSPEKQKRMMQLEAQVLELQKGLDKVAAGLQKFDQIAEERGISMHDDPRRMQLLRAKIKNEAVKGEYEMELGHLKMLAKRGERARIKVIHRMYVGTEVGIDDRRLKPQEDQAKIEFVKSQTGIRMQELY